MKRFIAATIAASALTAAVPAMAQTYLDDRASALDQRIDNGVSNGELTRGEARVLRDRLHDIQRVQDRYEADGMTSWERRAVERRYDNLSSDIASMRHNGEYSYRRYNDDVF